MQDMQLRSNQGSVRGKGQSGEGEERGAGRAKGVYGRVKRAFQGVVALSARRSKWDWTRGFEKGDEAGERRR